MIANKNLIIHLEEEELTHLNYTVNLLYNIIYDLSKTNTKAPKELTNAYKYLSRLNIYEQVQFQIEKEDE